MINTNKTIIKHFKSQIHEKAPLLSILILGFMSGLPFLLTLSTLSFWLAEVGISNTTIGLFMLVSLPYSFKFLWAPLLDHIEAPILGKYFGKRRSWLLLMQCGLLISLYQMSTTNPSTDIIHTAISAFFVSFFSASQDIIIDAYRIESIKSHHRGAAAALETVGFRFGMLASGAGALYLATLYSWQFAYLIMTFAVGISMIFTLIIKEPTHLQEINHLNKTNQPISLKKINHYLIKPFYQFAHRDKWVYIILFIFCFKLADTVMNAMSAPFLCDVGFSKIEFANVSKLFGITLMVFGGLTGGIMIHRMGIYQSAVMCVVLQSLSCLMFTIQALVGYDCSVLMITVGVESFCSGMTSTIFIAFLSEFCCQPHTATHFTMLYSLGSLSRAITSAFSGWLADSVGWATLFLMTSMIIFPALYCLTKIARSKPAILEDQKDIDKLKHIA